MRQTSTNSADVRDSTNVVIVGVRSFGLFPMDTK